MESGVGIGTGSRVLYYIGNGSISGVMVCFVGPRMNMSNNVGCDVPWRTCSALCWRATPLVMLVCAFEV
jgi:hypothetical protein